jgi:hypothetical protein
LHASVCTEDDPEEIAMKSSAPDARPSWSQDGPRADPSFRPVGYWDGRLMFIRAAVPAEPLDDSAEDEQSDGLDRAAPAAPGCPGRRGSPRT